MRILYTNFHPRNGGGHVTYILNLARGLAPHHQITVASPATSRLYRYAGEMADAGAEEGTEAGADVGAGQAAGAWANVTAVPMSFRNRAASLLSQRKAMRALIQQGRFDIIHVNGSADHRLVMLATVGMRRRPRIVFTKHNDLPLNTPGHWMRARFATDRVIAVSRFVAGLLADSAYGRLPTATVYHGIDTAYFAPPSPALLQGLRERWFGPTAAGKILLGSAGGTDLEKGWLDLLEGISMLEPDLRQRFRVLVAGDLPNESKMARVRELGLQDQVVFPGLLDDVRPALAACDIGFVLSYREALSFACREVMALGLPALVTSAGGLPENVAAGSDGWIVPVKDPAAIAQVLRDILADPARVAAMGAAARRKSEAEFNLECFVAATLAVYEAALRQGQRA